jgi:hypothetical protein
MAFKKHNPGCPCCEEAEDCLACLGEGTKPEELRLALKASVVPKGAGGGEPLPPTCLEKDLTITLSNADTPENCSYEAIALTPDREPNFWAQVGSTAAFLCGSITLTETPSPHIRQFHSFTLTCEDGAPVLRIVLRSINDSTVTPNKVTDATFRFSCTVVGTSPIELDTFVLEEITIVPSYTPSTPLHWIARIHSSCTCLEDPSLASLVNLLKPQLIDVP